MSGGFGVGAAGLSGAFASVHVANGNMYVADDFNDRVLVFAGIPTANGASAAYALGQPDLATVGGDGVSVSAMNNPGSPVVSGGRLFVSEFNNNRVSIYNALPTGSPGTIDVVLGQVDKNTGVPGACDAIGLQTPEAVWVVGGKIVVPDGDHHRVLIWNSIPAVDGTPADLVLGQADMTSCAANRGLAAAANSLSLPSAVWSDGVRLVVADTLNNRVLIWNSFPNSNGQAANAVIGQADFTSNAPGTTATTLNQPVGVFAAGAQLFVTDAQNNRVMIYND